VQKIDAHAYAGGVTRAALHPRFVAAEKSFEHQLDFAAGRFAPVQSRPDDARIVEDKKVSGRKKLAQFGEMSIDQSIFGDVKQSARRADVCRALGDQFRWKIEVEIGKAMGYRGRHDGGGCAAPFEAEGLFRDNAA
jgi:hypothetical protein